MTKSDEIKAIGKFITRCDRVLRKSMRARKTELKATGQDFTSHDVLMEDMAKHAMIPFMRRSLQEYKAEVK